MNNCLIYPLLTENRVQRIVWPVWYRDSCIKAPANQSSIGHDDLQMFHRRWPSSDMFMLYEEWQIWKEAVLFPKSWQKSMSEPALLPPPLAPYYLHCILNYSGCKQILQLKHMYYSKGGGSGKENDWEKKQFGISRFIKIH